MARERSGYVFEQNNKWYARVTFTDSFGKKRNLKKTAVSKADANKKLKILLKSLENEGEKVFNDAKISFLTLVDLYEREFVKPAKFVGNTKVEGLRNYKHIRAYLRTFRAFFGKKRVKDISYMDLQAFKAERLETVTQRKMKRSITTVNRELSCLRSILNFALQQDFIERNPFSRGKSLIQVSAERKREFILNAEQEKKLLEVCSVETREIKYKRLGKEVTVTMKNNRQHLKPLLVALLDTGARLGEMLKLTWQFVDFDERLITFQALTTKTLRTRQVALTQRLYDELQLLWNNSDKSANSLVFGITNNVRKSFASVCRDAGIKQGGIDGFTLHSCRHSCATRLVNGNLPIQFVARVLGHTQPMVTTFRYISTTNDVLHQAASILENS